ncbi:MAG: hypothetical protein KC656_19775, partial [Myxococcales bacterium]|nr:hypothetical protein [Myxococcales bacterium]
MKRVVIGLCTLVLGIGAFSVARERGTVHLPPPPAHLPTAPADEDDVRWSARNDLDLPERRDVALRVLGFLGHPDDAEVLWRRSLDDDAFGAVATSMLGRVSRDDPALRERLVALATSPDARHRASALEALGDLGTPGLDRLAAMGRTDGVLQGLARTRGGTDVAALARLSSGYGEDLALVQNDSRSLDVLEGADRLVAMALHDPERARLELDGRIAERKLDATTRAMIQALPPHAPWLQKVAAAEAPLEERAALLLHFEPDRLAELLGELVFPDPGAALLLHGPSMEAFRHAEAAGDVARMEEIVGAEWSPGQVPDELVTAVLASEPLRGSWLKLPKFLVAAGTPPALEHLFVAASQSAFGSGWVDAIGSIPDPTGAELLWDLVEMEGATGVQEAALKALVARGPEHLERALQTARAEVGRRVDRATLKLLLERGGPEDQEAVLELCVQGTRVECEAVVYEARRWSAIARLADIAGDADDPIRVAILTNALRNGRLDDRIHTWIGDADPVVA